MEPQERVRVSTERERATVRKKVVSQWESSKRARGRRGTEEEEEEDGITLLDKLRRRVIIKGGRPSDGRGDFNSTALHAT